jgi:guanylate kinase
VAGPAGVGKSTLLKRLIAEEAGLVKAVSVTTRAPRSGEVDGVAYHFWDEARFEAAVERGEFLEFAQVHGKGNWYGTLERFVVEQMAAGHDVIKDIDVQGVEQMRKLAAWRGKTVSVFILPPSQEELERRLDGRASETAITKQARLASAAAELARVGEFDYVVVNDSVERAVSDLKAIRTAEHCRTGRHDGWK